MKKMTLVIVLALVLTFAFTASAFATTGKFYKGGVDYYTWANPTNALNGSPSPGTGWVASGLSGLGVNGLNPGVHANYLANTAKCGICHSVHRANGLGDKLLPTADTTCAGCHTGGTAITNKMITWGVFNPNWRVNTSDTVSAWAYGGAGPHNDALDTLYGDGEWDGLSTPVAPSYDVGPPFARYGCLTRRCHATNPHGANASRYTIFAAKLLFNESPAQDNVEYPDLLAENGPGTYGGLDAAYNALGATDASVQRFIDANPTLIRVSAAAPKLLEINKNAGGWRLPDGNEVHTLVAGLTCGRPSNPKTGEDECHAEASYAIFDKGVTEMRNHGTKIQGNVFDGSDATKNQYRTDNTGVEYPGFGGNDHRDLKTGHVAGTFAAVPGAASYVAIAGCVSCHDQTDGANNVFGNYTFPHGQTPVGATNAQTASGGTGTGQRSRIWSGWAGYAGAQRVISGSNEKAFDGQCLKCHRNTGNTGGIGITN